MTIIDIFKQLVSHFISFDSRMSFDPAKLERAIKGKMFNKKLRNIIKVERFVESS